MDNLVLFLRGQQVFLEQDRDNRAIIFLFFI